MGISLFLFLPFPYPIYFRFNLNHVCQSYWLIICVTVLLCCPCWDEEVNKKKRQQTTHLLASVVNGLHTDIALAYNRIHLHSAQPEPQTDFSLNLTEPPSLVLDLQKVTIKMCKHCWQDWVQFNSHCHSRFLCSSRDKTAYAIPENNTLKQSMHKKIILIKEPRRWISSILSGLLVSFPGSKLFKAGRSVLVWFPLVGMSVSVQHPECQQGCNCSLIRVPLACKPYPENWRAGWALTQSWAGHSRGAGRSVRGHVSHRNNEFVSSDKAAHIIMDMF